MSRSKAPPRPMRSEHSGASLAAAVRASGRKNLSPELDEYTARAQPFAKPILSRVRSLFHRAHPEITEALKWEHPAFEHKGIIGGLPAFKQHVRPRFWKGSLLKDPHGLFRDANGTAGVLVLTEESQLPPEELLLDFIRQPVELNVAGAKVLRVSAGKGKASPLAVPDDLIAALRRNKRAQLTSTK